MVLFAHLSEEESFAWVLCRHRSNTHTKKKRCVRYQQRFALNQLPRPPRGWDGGLRHEKGSERNVILWCGASFVAIYAGGLQITFFFKPAVACFTRRKNTLGAGRDAPRDDGWRDTKAGGGEHGTRWVRWPHTSVCCGGAGGGRPRERGRGLCSSQGVA